MELVGIYDLQWTVTEVLVKLDCLAVVSLICLECNSSDQIIEEKMKTVLQITLVDFTLPRLWGFLHLI